MQCTRLHCNTQGVDPIIYRDPLRSPQFDSTYLNNPSFVGSFEDTEFVYFIFREGGGVTMSMKLMMIMS